LDAAENPLLDPVVWIILGLVFVAAIAGLAVLFKTNAWFAALPATTKIGGVLVLLVGGILVVLLAMLSRG
jgi:hypothetical protein